MNAAKYYILDVDLDEGEDESFPMELGSMPILPDRKHDNWLFGKPFTIAPEEPIVMKIDEGCDDCEEVPFHHDPAIASQAFIDALLEAGVDNIVTYDAILQSSTDENFQIKGYKAFNIIGRFSAAGPETKFLTESREIDASIEDFQPEPDSIKGSYMFRLAESCTTIVIHEKVKIHLETKGFKRLDFSELKGAFIL